jgi:hypothetical protein
LCMATVATPPAPIISILPRFFIVFIDVLPSDSAHMLYCILFIQFCSLNQATK